MSRAQGSTSILRKRSFKTISLYHNWIRYPVRVPSHLGHIYPALWWVTSGTKSYSLSSTREVCEGIDHYSWWMALWNCKRRDIVLNDSLGYLAMQNVTGDISCCSTLSCGWRLRAGFPDTDEAYSWTEKLFLWRFSIEHVFFSADLICVWETALYVCQKTDPYRAVA